VKLIRSYTNKVVANIRSDRILPWEVGTEADEGNYMGKGGWAGY